MNRLGLVLAIAALTVAGACSGSDGGKSATDTNTEQKAPAQITFKEACPDVQAALDSSFPNPDGLGSAKEYQAFGDKIRGLSSKVSSDAKLLVDVATASYGASSNRDDSEATPSDNLAAEGAWLDAMKVVTDRCEAVGSPLS